MILKNKFIKPLSLGIACFMLSVLISVNIPQYNAVSLASEEIHNTIINPCEDPPFHERL